MNHVTQYICPDDWHAQYMAATRLNITQYANIVKLITQDS